MKFSAVVATSFGICGASPAFLSSMTTAVTMFVFTPVIRWTLTHSASSRVTPYFTSNQRMKRDVQKPDESGANVVSTARMGRLLNWISRWRIGVSAGFSRAFRTLLKCIPRLTWPRSTASSSCVMNRRAENREYTFVVAAKT